MSREWFEEVQSAIDVLTGAINNDELTLGRKVREAIAVNSELVEKSLGRSGYIPLAGRLHGQISDLLEQVTVELQDRFAQGSRLDLEKVYVEILQRMLSSLSLEISQNKNN